MKSNETEILAILKRWLKNSTTDSSLENIIIEGDVITEDEFLKVSRWLEEEND